MGVMEGTMAGFMGGLMGAMTSLMMYNDNLRAAGVIVFLISATILFGLNYKIFKEIKETGMERKKMPDDFLTFLLSLILIAASVWMMVLGPRSVLFG